MDLIQIPLSLKNVFSQKNNYINVVFDNNDLRPYLIGRYSIPFISYKI